MENSSNHTPEYQNRLMGCVATGDTNANHITRVSHLPTVILNLPMHGINYLGLPRCKTCEICLCFLAIVKARVCNVDFFLSFVLHNWC